MFSLAPYFWPWFGAIMAAGVVLTMALCALIAVAGPPWTGPGRLSPPAPGHPEQLPPAGDHGRDEHAGRKPAAA